MASKSTAKSGPQTPESITHNIIKKAKGTTKVQNHSNPFYAHLVDEINGLAADEELTIPVPDGKDSKKYLAYMRSILKAKGRRESITQPYSIRTSSDGKVLVIWLEPEEEEQRA